MHNNTIDFHALHTHALPYLPAISPPREGRIQALKVTPQGNIPVELVLHTDHVSLKPHRAESARNR